MSARTLTPLSRIYLLGLLLSILPGSWAQVQLVETGGKVTTEGQSVTLTCRTSGFSFKDFAMSWHWSPTESYKEFVARVSPKTGSNKEYSPKFQGRASITRNNEARTVSLTLHQLQEGDSGIYYCNMMSLKGGSLKWHSLGFFLSNWEYFGPGTELTVLPVEQTVLEESGGGSHRAGKTLNLKCQTSGFQFKTSKLGWYLWAPGHAPLWLTSLKSSSTQAREDRITTSREDAGSWIFLRIEGLDLRDSGQYHCARRVGNGDDTDKLVFGRGTDVTVEPGPRAPLSPSVFLMRNQDSVACLIRNYYPKELQVSLAFSGALISHQSFTLSPMANGTYSAVKIGRVAENDTVTCSVKHLGKDIHVSHQPDHTGPDPGIASEQKLSRTEQKLMEETEQGNKLFLSVMGLRLLFMKTVAIHVLFTAMALIS
ncbi:uncharacterized protein LOC118833587 [Trichosurus vulpecula]|uniref:uncharacterized protein LOC118833587 n=1 Tax=Trichosurus vulpecula TaxID=9337 RepID=UPI00186B1278|nr:uncharacterized protein LOC118833587 [Trichosurus vulpecula]